MKKRWIMALTRQRYALTGETYFPGQCYESERSLVVLESLETHNRTIHILRDGSNVPIENVADITNPFDGLLKRQLRNMLSFYLKPKGIAMPSQSRTNDELIEAIEAELADQGLVVVPQPIQEEQPEAEQAIQGA